MVMNQPGVRNLFRGPPVQRKAEWRSVEESFEAECGTARAVIYEE